MGSEWIHEQTSLLKSKKEEIIRQVTEMGDDVDVRQRIGIILSTLDSLIKTSTKEDIDLRGIKEKLFADAGEMDKRDREKEKEQREIEKLKEEKDLKHMEEQRRLFKERKRVLMCDPMGLNKPLGIGGKDNFGYDANDGSYVDMLKEGIIDPTKVARIALENAASVAGMILTTECALVDIKEEAPPAAPPMGGGGMPGMM